MGCGCTRDKSIKAPTIQRPVNREEEKKNSNKVKIPPGVTTSTIQEQPANQVIPEKIQNPDKIQEPEKIPEQQKMQEHQKAEEPAKIEEPKKNQEPEISQEPEAQVQPNDSAELSDFARLDQYNTIVWAPNPDTLSEFFNVPTRKFNHRDGPLNFIFYPVTTTEPKHVPKVVDCIIFMVENPSKDKSSIQALKKHFALVWNFKILSNTNEDLSSLAESLGLTVAKSLQEAVDSLHSQNKHFSSLIQEVFSKIDHDGNGCIDLNEMGHAASLLGIDFSQEEIENSMKEMDLNSDGKICFQEFMYWWKRGRQGATSIKNLLGSWAHQLSASIPGSIEVLTALGFKRSLVSRRTINRSLSYQIGPEVSAPAIQLGFKLGKAAKREQIVDIPNQLLEFRSKPTWFSLEFNLKNSLSEEVINSLEEMIEAQMNAYKDASFDGEELKNMWGKNIKLSEGVLYFGVWFNFDHEIFQGIFKEVSYIEDFMKTPVDDSIEFKIKSNASLQDFEKNELIDCANKGMTIDVQCETWNRLAEVFEQAIKSDSVIKNRTLFWLLMSGSMNFKSDRCKELPSWTKEHAGTAVKFITNFLDKSPLAGRALSLVSNICKDEMKLIVRYNNFGAEFDIQGNGLSELLQKWCQ